MALKQFFQNTRAEIKQVQWPTRRHVIAFTAVVIVVSAVVGYLLGAFDLLFQIGLKEVVF